jgi:O-antigen/teichoic acid export membrane protein
MKQKIHRLLRWSEKYTKTDMVYLAGGGFWLVVGQIGMFIFSFILTWVFANFLDKDIYGTYKFVLSIFTFLSITTLSGLGISMCKSVSQSFDGSILQTIKTRIRWGIVGFVGSLIVSLYYYTNGDFRLSAIFAMISVFIPLAESFADYQLYLRGKKDFKFQSIYALTQRAVLSVVVILTIILTKNIYWVVLSYIASFTILNYIMYKLSLMRHPPSNHSDPKVLKYGYHLSAMSFLRTCATQIDKVLLFHFVGPVALATYFFAIAIPNELISLFAQINSLAFPKFSTNNDRNAQKALIGKIIKFSILLVIPVVIYIIIAPGLFKFFFPEYMDSIFYSQMFSITILFVPFSLINQFFSANSKTGAMYITNVIEPTILIILFLMLLPTLGIMGGIISLIIKSFLSALLLLGLFIINIRKS